jgi:NADH:ubiquinone oxidoreductase subunit 4 (subunit M)
MLLQAMTFSLPLVLMVMLVSELEKRYESAYAGIVSGIAQAQPRLSGMLVMVTLAVIGSPVFPSYFSMLHNITGAIAAQPMLAAGTAVVWLMWSWSAIRLLQELLVGPALVLRHESIGRQDMGLKDMGQNDMVQNDMGKGAVFIYGALLVMLVVAGISITEVLV